MAETLQNKALAEQILSKSIQEVVFKYNAYAPIISSFRIAYTDTIPTMGVDKYARLVVNPEFVVENEQCIKGLIIHEVLHMFFGHTTDARTELAYNDDVAHNRLVNIAEDCAINQFISEPLPDGAVTPYSLSMQLNGAHLEYNESAEYYYHKIMENRPLESGAPQGGQQQLAGGDSTGDVNTTAMQDELDKMGIEHISQEEVNDKVMQTAQEVCKSAGNQYGALTEFAKQLLEPKVDWRPLLQATIRNAEKRVWVVHSHQTFKRTSRRSQTFLLPKRCGRKIAVSLSFDTSGSISPDMVNQFLSEIQACMRYSEIKECALWHTSNYWYGTPEQLMQDVEKVFESGGTDEASMGRAEAHVKADLYIHFSDGEHGENYGFTHPQKNIEIVWEDNNIKEIRRF